MKIKRILATLCALSLLGMNATVVMPALAEGDGGEQLEAAAQAQTEVVSNKKKKKKKKDDGVAPATIEDLFGQGEEESPEPEKEPEPEQPAEPAPPPAEIAPAPEEPTPAPEAPTPAPEAPTPAPEAPTPAPEAPTPAPETPTPAPEAPTPAPGEPTEVPVEVTVEPSPEATEGATEQPPLKLGELTADKGEVAPGRNVRFTIGVENADIVTWTAQRTDGQIGGSGEVEGGAFRWRPPVSGIYTVTVTASAGEQVASQSCTVIVRAAQLQVEVTAPTGYAQVGGEDLKYVIKVTGGCEPYTAAIKIRYKENDIYESNVLTPEVICKPLGFGENKLKVTITDAMGDKVKAECIIVSASNEKNEAPNLPMLDGDMTFAERVVAVAKSQLGYRESEENFVFREDDGSVQGWSYYGGWYGMPYEEWCAMFASYCLEKADIGEGIMPHSANCNRWKGYLGERYIDEEETYIPEPGDLIFFHYERTSNDPNFPNHIGIVTGYDPEAEMVYTVEGNSGKGVKAHQYAHDYAPIVGYASMRYCMTRWDNVYKERMNERLSDKLEGFEGAPTRAGKGKKQ